VFGSAIGLMADTRMHQARRQCAADDVGLPTTQVIHYEASPPYLCPAGRRGRRPDPHLRPRPIAVVERCPTKQAIVDFVSTTTESGGAKFIAPEERIVRELNRLSAPARRGTPLNTASILHKCPKHLSSETISKFPNRLEPSLLFTRSTFV
jgi:hypothetical protein